MKKKISSILVGLIALSVINGCGGNGEMGEMGQVKSLIFHTLNQTIITILN